MPLVDKTCATCRYDKETCGAAARYTSECWKKKLELESEGDQLWLERLASWLGCEPSKEAIMSAVQNWYRIVEKYQRLDSMVIGPMCQFLEREEEWTPPLSPAAGK